MFELIGGRKEIGMHMPVGGVLGMYIVGVQYAKVGQSHTAMLSKYMDVKTQNLLGSRSVHHCKLWEVGRFKTSIFPSP